MSPLDIDQSEPTTEIDSQIGQPTFAINFIARPTDTFHDPIVGLQTALAAALPDGVFTCPLESLHLTVASLIWARGTYAVDVKQWWADHGAAATDGVTDLARDSGLITLACDGLNVFPGAIAVSFKTSPAIEVLRTKISEAQLVDGGMSNVPDFTHVTLFRFEAEMPLSRLTQVVEEQTVPHEPWDIDRLVLCQEEIYPSLQYTDITSIRLAG